MAQPIMCHTSSDVACLPGWFPLLTEVVKIGSGLLIDGPHCRPINNRQGRPHEGRWVLRGEMQWRHQGNHAMDEFMAEVAATIGEQQLGMAPGSSTGAPPLPECSLMAGLSRAVEWYQQGLLSEAEFQATKHALGLC